MTVNLRVICEATEASPWGFNLIHVLYSVAQINLWITLESNKMINGKRNVNRIKESEKMIIGRWYIYIYR